MSSLFLSIERAIHDQIYRNSTKKQDATGVFFATLVFFSFVVVVVFYERFFCFLFSHASLFIVVVSAFV